MKNTIEYGMMKRSKIEYNYGLWHTKWCGYRLKLCSKQMYDLEEEEAAAVVYELDI